MSTSDIKPSDTTAAPSDSSPDDSTDLPLDTVFEILKNRRRRDILQYLWNHDGTANIGELAEHIAALENDIDVAALSSSQRKRVYIGLYQCHLPKMDDADIVDFDKHRGTIELCDVADELTAYLQASETSASELSTTSVGVALAVGTLVPLGVLGIYPLGLVAPFVWALIGTAALLFVTADQLRRDETDYDLLASMTALRARLSTGESPS
jgi:hypothetical protein